MFNQVLEELERQPVIGLDSEQKQVTDLLQHTVCRGGSNSALLLGPIGCGKTALVNQAIKACFEQKSFKEAMLVRLHGLVQTDDRLALQEIARQLRLENVVGERVFGSFAEHLSFLLESLKSGDKGSRPIIFILDDFHIFTQHHNQTLLYNLFDVAQSKAVPMLVLGLTPRVDIVESLEKRVKSRFCHRVIHIKKITDFEEYLRLVRHLLTPSKASKEWKRAVDSFTANKVAKQFFKKVFYKDCSPGFLKRLILRSLLYVEDPEEPFFDISCFEGGLRDLAPDYNEVILRGLSVLDFTLIIAAKHLVTIYETDNFNFEMVYGEFHKFSSRKCSAMLNFDRDVIKKSWETLAALELIRPLDRNLGGGRVQAEYKQYTLDVRPEEVDRVAATIHGLPIDVKEWATSGISGA